MTSNKVLRFSTSNPYISPLTVSLTSLFMVCPHLSCSLDVFELAACFQKASVA
jgi:hypothetical protein